MEFIHKTLCIYSYMSKLQSLSKSLQLIQYTYWDFFFTTQNSFWMCQSWYLLVLLSFFVLPLPHRQNFPFEDIFSSGKTKTPLGWNWVNGKVEHGGHADFGQTLLNTQHSASRCAHKSPIRKWTHMLKESSKNIH